MKRAILTILAIGGVLLPSRADERGVAAINKLSAQVGAMKHYEIRFEVAADGVERTTGVVVVSGARYNIKVADREQFSDGRARYDVSPAEREVVIDRIDALSHNILLNPAQAFNFAASDFDARSISASKVELTPKNRTVGVGKIIISINASTGLPAELIYDYDGQQVRIVIISFTALSSVDEALFKYVATKYRGWEIVDFR